MRMLKYFIEFSYNGTLYRGAAKQSGRNSIRDIDTVQGVLETAFTCLEPQPKSVFIHLASRTDSGVHALHTIAAVNIVTSSDDWYGQEYVLSKVNKFMYRTENSIRLLDCFPVDQGLFVRHIVKSRTYLYRFLIAKEFGEHKVPMMEHQRTLIVRSECFDIQRLEQALQLFMGRKNFMTFAACKKSPVPINYERSLKELRLEKAHALTPFDSLSDNFNYWHIICSSRAFLYNQVRRIVGALIALATGRITERDISIMLTVPSHSHWIKNITPAQPYGLYLAKTEYDKDLLNNYIIKDKLDESSLQKECAK